MMKPLWKAAGATSYGAFARIARYVLIQLDGDKAHLYSYMNWSARGGFVGLRDSPEFEVGIAPEELGTALLEAFRGCTWRKKKYQPEYEAL